MQERLKMQEKITALHCLQALINQRIRIVQSLILSLVLIVCTPLQSQDLQVGISNFNPPFSIRISEKSFAGFDIDLMDEICFSMSIECHYKPILFKDFYKTINDGEVDIIVSSVIVTPERELNYLFSDVYLKSYARIVTKANSPYTDVSSLLNQKIGVIAGTPYVSLAKKLFGQKIQLISYLEEYDLLMGLQSEKVGAILIDAKAANYWFGILNTDGSIESDISYIGKQIPIGLGYGIMMQKSNTTLHEKINQALRELIDNGRYQRLYDNYFGD